MSLNVEGTITLLLELRLNNGCIVHSHHVTLEVGWYTAR